MRRRAVLIFADHLGAHLARRGFPVAAQQILRSPAKLKRIGGADVHLFTSATTSKGCARIHAQRGACFMERFENAIEKLAALGYEEIVIVGRDCPNLLPADIAFAFSRLQHGRLVLGPDHRGGCYLIAFRIGDRALVRGVHWKRNTDCAELQSRCRGNEVSLLEMKHDVDSWADLRLLARLGDACARLAVFLIDAVCASGRETAPFVDLAAHFARVRGQMPPPAFAD